MRNRCQAYWFAAIALMILSINGAAQAQEPANHPVGKNLSEMKFVTVPGLPSCAPGSLQSGDPAKGPSVILSRIAAGCTIPWHWHTPNEHLMMVSGVARVETKGAKPLTLRAGGFAMMPSRHIHQFRCAGPCVLYIYSDTAFDIHYVDNQEKEISPAEALKAVKETMATPMK